MPRQLTLPIVLPFDWEGILQYLALRAIPGVEYINPQVYRRTVYIDGQAGWVEVRRVVQGLTVHCEGVEPRSHRAVEDRLIRLFDSDFTPGVLHESFADDPLLNSIWRCCPGVRIPGCWDGFELTIRTILGQQISVRAASTLAGCMAKNFGLPDREKCLPEGLTHWFPCAEQLLEVLPERFGIPAARAWAIHKVAEALGNGSLQFNPEESVESWMKAFRALPGIGPWTASYVAMRALKYRDALPSGDLALQRAADPRGKGLSAKGLERLAESWRPWRAYAAALLWRQYGERKAFLQSSFNP